MSKAVGCAASGVASLRLFSLLRQIRVGCGRAKRACLGDLTSTAGSLRRVARRRFKILFPAYLQES